MAISCGGPAPTSTTPSWPRPCAAPATRSTCSARTVIPSGCPGSTRSGHGATASWRSRPSASPCSPPSTARRSGPCCPSTWPPGVDIDQFVPRAPEDASAALHALAERLAAEAPAAAAGDAFARDHAAAGRALAALDGGRDPLVAFVGKLIVSKGFDLLLAAWPLVLAEVPAARLVLVGFGAYRDGLDALQAALAAGALARAVELDDAGRAPAGGP